MYCSYSSSCAPYSDVSDETTLAHLLFCCLSISIFILTPLYIAILVRVYLTRHSAALLFLNGSVYVRVLNIQIEDNY